MLVGMLVTAGAAPFAASWTAAGADYVARSLALFAAAAVVVVGLAGARHPWPRFGAANGVTVLRVAVIALTGGLIGEPPGARVQWLAVAAMIVVAVLDGVDGWLARRTGLATPFGARFDMETDAAAILILSVLVWQNGKAGAWVIACGLMRYAFVAAGWVLPWIAGPLRSTPRGKSVAIAQMVGLSAALSPLVPLPYSIFIAGLTLAALVWSFTVDIIWLKRQHG